MSLLWVYAMYFALFKPFSTDNTAVVVSRVFLMGGVLEHARPNLVYYASIYFLSIHLWRLGLTLKNWWKNRGKEEDQDK